MRQVTVMAILFFCLTTSYSLAQMGHGMMRDSQMMQGQDMKSTGQMVEHGQMMDVIKGMTLDMSTMMGKLSGMMDGEMSREKMHKTSELIRDVAAEMNRMSFMIDKGSVTLEEMKDLQNRVIEIQKQMLQIKKQ